MNTPPPVLLKVYKYAYKLKADGKTNEEIKQELLEQGLDDKSSVIIAENIDRSFGEIRAKERKKKLTYGLLWSLCGIAVIMLTYYNNLHNSGYPYFIACVAVLFGSVRLFGALLQHKIIH